MKLENSRQIFGKYSVIKFRENPLSGSRFVSRGRVTDGQTVMAKLIVAFFAVLRTRLNTPRLGIFSLLCLVNKIVFTDGTKNSNNKFKSDASFHQSVECYGVILLDRLHM